MKKSQLRQIIQEEVEKQIEVIDNFFELLESFQIIDEDTTEWSENKKIKEFKRYNKEFVVTYNLIIKFGYKSVLKYLRELSDWICMGSFEDDDVNTEAIKILYDGRNIFNFYVPEINKNGVLYRGLGNLKKIPKKKQNIVYSPNKGLSSWTENEEVAKRFANSNTGRNVILVVDRSEIIKKSDIIFYNIPEKSELSKLIYGKFCRYDDEREWVVKIKKPINIKEFYVL